MDNDKVLPNALEAERAVIGAILLDDSSIYPASEVLTEGDFYLESHRKIFAYMLAMASQSRAIDNFTLIDELRRRDDLEVCGGPAYLASLTEGLPRAVNVGHYARIVKAKSKLRGIIEISNDAMQRAYDATETPREILDVVQREMIALDGNEGGGLRPLAEIVDAGIKELDKRKEGSDANSVLTGLADIDRNTGGLWPADLIILAARPSQGKSALAGNIAVNAGKKGKRVAVFSIEMGNTQIYKRMLAAECNLNCFALVCGQFSKSDWPAIMRGSERLQGLPVWIDDTGSLNMAQLRARATRLKLEHGLDLVIVDYLQLIIGPGKSIYERVTEISRGLKILAKDLRVPVLALSQLHRLQDESGEPQLSDLKESGAIEQDADMAFFLWPSKFEGRKQFKIGKQRNGPLISFELGWEKSETRFYDAAQMSLYEK